MLSHNTEIFSNTTLSAIQTRIIKCHQVPRQCRALHTKPILHKAELNSSPSKMESMAHNETALPEQYLSAHNETRSGNALYEQRERTQWCAESFLSLRHAARTRLNLGHGTEFRAVDCFFLNAVPVAETYCRYSFKFRVWSRVPGCGLFNSHLNVVFEVDKQNKRLCKTHFTVIPADRCSAHLPGTRLGLSVTAYKIHFCQHQSPPEAHSVQTRRS